VLGNSWAAERLAASKKWLSFVELYIYISKYLTACLNGNALGLYSGVFDSNLGRVNVCPHWIPRGFPQSLQAKMSGSYLDLATPFQNAFFFSILVVCRRFGGTHCLHLQGQRVSQESSSFLARLLVVPKFRQILPNYTASHSRIFGFFLGKWSVRDPRGCNSWERAPTARQLSSVSTIGSKIGPEEGEGV
jgi:hypothetical protein